MKLSDPSDLVNVGLVNDAPQTAPLFIEIWGGITVNLQAPSEIVRSFWAEVETRNLNNNTRGALFEILIGVLLLRAKVRPFFRQAEVAFVNNARFDFLLWDQGKFPIAISVKTSLRERYKQAILESDALKSVHKWAQCFVVTMNAEEVAVRRRLETKGLQHSSVDAYILANSLEFDSWLETISEMTFADPELIRPMANNHRVDIKL